MNIIINLTSGALSGLIEGLVTHPIDYTKIKLQENQLKNKYIVGNKIKYTVSHTYRNYGITGFYRGLGPKLGGVIPMRLFYWGVLNDINMKLRNENDSQTMKLNKLVASGVITGSLQTFIENPIEVMKINMMTNYKVKTSEVFKHILKTYPGAGFKVTLVRNIPFAICTNIGVFWNSNNSPYQQFLYGATGGFIGCIISQPFDYIKTDNQRHRNTKPLGFRDIIKIWKTDPKKLWTGGLARAILGFCTMGIGAVCFCQIYNRLNQLAYSEEINCTKY